MQAIQWVQAHWALILSTLLVIVNEAIAWNPNLKQNSLIQLILRLSPPASQGSLLSQDLSKVVK